MKNFFEINNKPLARQALTAILAMALLLVLYGKANAAPPCTGATIYISGTVIWSGTPDPCFVGQNIEVTDGATFTISGCTLDFQSGCGIYNAPTSTSPSQLIITSSSVLEGISGGDWAGIMYEGIANSGGGYSEYDPVSYLATATQNSVTIQNSTIQDAAIGVQVFNLATLDVSGSVFLDNVVGVLIEASQADNVLPNIMSSSSYYPSASYIQTTTFNISNTNPYNSHIDQYICVQLENTQYLELMQNTFECTHASVTSWTNSGDRATGIEGTDASFSLHHALLSPPLNVTTKCPNYDLTTQGNVFKWLGNGIQTINSGGSPYNTYTAHVSYCTFQECFQAMYIQGGWFHTIEHNPLIRFDPTQGSASTYWDPGIATQWTGIDQYLVELYGASDFIFYANTMSENMLNTIFLFVASSGDHPTQISGNTFTNTCTTPNVATYADYEAAIYFLGENSREEVTDNTFGANHYDGIATDNSGTLPLDPFGDIYNGVQNTFGGSLYTPNGHNLANYGSGSGAASIYYYSHSPVGTSLSTYQFNGLDATHGDNPDDSKLETCINGWPLKPNGGGGINEGYGSMPDIRVYPNPANGQLIFDLSAVSGVRGAMVTIVDVLGKVIGSYNYNDMEQNMVVNTSEYKPGIYIYRLTMNGYMENTGKFEVNH